MPLFFEWEHNDQTMCLSFIILFQINKLTQNLEFETMYKLNMHSNTVYELINLLINI